ncbi:arsenate reductase family protein [Frisingicoccus sp.]|uniref:arsenate reductase family protein n=1 Tax=Frisingicoccus sp. TaxID=1918627 RepID=UPI00261DC063|nr:arsenate reductase family protein [Frisingicoccus sp.]MDD6232313.1 arsenate reductase family protein [Frisingicoccus sp.]MDY4922019.1 arsenate reductase family protein [Frisingicoccus sp.]MDY5956815.1 arsenate reductase family protein [Frisingicoccus sp.]
MSRLFVEYPKCSTCRKAKKYLEENQVDFIDRHIVEERPTEDELTKWIQMSGLPVKKFFNTSGKLYKEMGLKDKLAQMPEADQIKLLASDGMLVKRPLIIEENRVLVGFKEAEWVFE